VRSLGTETGTETLVSVNVKWDGNHYQLSNRIFGPSTGDIEPRFQMRVSPAIASANPVLFQDHETAVFLAVPNRRTSGFPVFRYPECKLCRRPENYLISQYVYQDFQMRVTITEQCTVERIAVLIPGPSLAAEKTAESMKKNWRISPAIDSEGKPFSIRVNLKVTFWQSNMSWNISYIKDRGWLTLPIEGPHKGFPVPARFAPLAKDAVLEVATRSIFTRDSDGQQRPGYFRDEERSRFLLEPV
jgi:hypothetical protein